MTHNKQFEKSIVGPLLTGDMPLFLITNRSFNFLSPLLSNTSSVTLVSVKRKLWAASSRAHIILEVNARTARLTDTFKDYPAKIY